MVDSCNIAVIVPTYNRSDSCRRLLAELRRCRPAPAALVVVDSSDEPDGVLETDPEVCYIRSRHKNQPYQRYVGLLAAAAPFVVFLDDDLFVEDDAFLGYLAQAFERPEVVGAAVGIDHAGGIESSFGEPRTAAAGSMLKAWHRIPRRRKPGSIGMTGSTGGAVTSDRPVQFLRGAVMAFRRDVVPRLFDDALFALFEAGLGMGEDKAISVRANAHGTLWQIARVCLRHPPTETSHYAAAPRRFLTRVLISRLLLARAYCETFGRPRLLAESGFALHLLRTLASGALRAPKERGLAWGAVKDALKVVRSTGLAADRLAPGVDFSRDAQLDAGLALPGGLS